MNKSNSYPFTFGVAIATLERAFAAKYIGTCVPDYITNEERGEFFHRFQVTDGCDQIVPDRQLFQVANRYAS